MIDTDSSVASTTAAGLTGPDAQQQYVTFSFAHQSYALPLDKVERVVRMVAIAPVPEAPPWFSGVIDLHGSVVPVLDLRQRFGHPGSQGNPDDRLVIIRLESGTLALVADEVTEVLDVPAQQLEKPPKALAGSRPLAAVIRCDDGLTLVLDAEHLLPAGEEWTRWREVALSGEIAALQGEEQEGAAAAPHGPEAEVTTAGSDHPARPGQNEKTADRTRKPRRSGNRASPKTTKKKTAKGTQPAVEAKAPAPKVEGKAVEADVEGTATGSGAVAPGASEEQRAPAKARREQ
jgi:purine-binding chemotaxis protein CheW